MIPREISSLVEHNMATVQVLDRAAAAPRCDCGGVFQGQGGVRWCARCGHTIAAADIDHETHAPLTGGAR